MATIVPTLVKAGKCAEILKSNGVLSNSNQPFDKEQTQSFIEEFSKNLQENFNLKKVTWNPLQSLHNSELSNPLKSAINPFVSINLSFDDLNNEKNSFLALAFQQMQTPKQTLLEINR